MKDGNFNILTINAGSSSIKIALYEMQDELKPIISGKIERIGSADAIFTLKQNNTKSKESIDASSFDNATISLINWFEKFRKNSRVIMHSS